MNNNITSLASTLQSAVSDVQSRLNTTQTQLASGKQILSKQEDSVVTRLSNQVNSQNRVQDNIDNANNVIAITQTALDSISTILINMKDLATQVSNGLYNATDQSNLSNAFANLNTQITNIASSANINGNNLLTDNQTLTVVSASDGINNQKTLVQGIDVAGLQSALNNLSFATSSIVELTKSAVQVGVLPISGINAEQDIQFNAMATGNTASVGGLTFTANSNLTAIEVAAIFAGKITSGTDPVAGIGSFNSTTFVGGYTAPASGTAIIKFTATVAGPNTLSVSGTVAPLTALAAGAVASTRTGVTQVLTTNEVQTISFVSMANGDTVTAGGLAFTANTDLTETEVATIFANKISSGTNSAAGTFSNSFVGDYTVVNSGVGSVIFTAITAGAHSDLTASSATTNRNALSSANKTIHSAGGGTNASISVALQALQAGDTATIGDLSFQASKNVTPAQLSTIFASKIANSSFISPYGSFISSGSTVGSNWTVTGSGTGTLTLTGIDTAARSLNVSGRTINAALQTSDISRIQNGTAPVTAVNAYQTIQFYSLKAGESATLGGLTFTAAQDLTAGQVAYQFWGNVNKSPGINASEGTFVGSFDGSEPSTTFNFPYSYTRVGNGILDAYATSPGPKSLIFADGSVISGSGSTALRAEDVVSVTPGVNSSSGTYAQDTIQFHDLYSGQQISVKFKNSVDSTSTLQFTTNTFVSASALATLFAAKITTPNSTNSPTGGAFSTTGTNSGWGGVAGSDGLLTLTATTVGSKNYATSIDFFEVASASSSNIHSSSSLGITTQTSGVDPITGVLAQQTVSLYALNKGDSATIGGLILTAAEDLTANQVASIFAAKITNNSNNPNSTTEGTFNATTFVGGFNATSLNNVLTLEADSFGPKGNISVGGAVTATTALSAANVTTVAAGYVGTVGVLAQQTVSLYALNKGDSATIGGLILTAAEDLTANQVASIFAAKITNNSNNPNSTTEGTFNATTFVGGFNATSLNNVLTLEADSFGPKGNISVGGAVTATTALSAANVTTVVSGSNGTAGVYDKQSVNIDSLKAGDSTTINGLTLTTAEDLTADQVASIFADKINSSVNPALSTGSFSGISLTEDFTAISINNVLTLTNKTYGPKNAITASKTVGGVDNALVGITSINDLMTIISANQATLEAASNNLSIAANTSIQIADQSQKKINEIENVDFTALQAALQMLNTQQSLDFYIVSQLNNTASSLLSIFR